MSTSVHFDWTGSALTLWAYDDRYRLTNETVIAGAVTNATSYTWDSADNRLSKTVAVSTNGTFATVSTAAYSNNALNQIVSSIESRQSEDVSRQYSYDSNGARTNTTETVSTASTASMNVTVYSYDEDNRLMAADILEMDWSSCSGCGGSGGCIACAGGGYCTICEGDGGFYDGMCVGGVSCCFCGEKGVSL